MEEPDSALRSALRAALALQVAWGADEALGDAAPDRTAPPPATPPAAGSPAVRTPAAPPTLPAHVPGGPDARFPGLAPDDGPAPPRRLAARAAAAAAVLTPAALRAADLAAAANSLPELKTAMEAFDATLRDTATNIVFADGAAGSGLMMIGEAPGADEDRIGKPFVGVSGRLLDRMVASIGLDRERDFYVTNILCWRPPGNRTPTDSEVSLFLPFIRRHVALARPRHVVLLGGTAAKALLGAKEGITRLRGRWHSLEVEGLGTVPALATLHPAYLLRQPSAKREAWQDLLLLRRTLDAG